jgi:hypothetical protein
MLLSLLGGRRRRLLIVSQATVPVLIILVTTVSCSGPHPDLPTPIADVVDLFSGTGTPKPKLAQRDKGQPKIPQAAAKEANAPSPSDAQKEKQLYQEFLEWRKNQKDQK